MIQRLELVGADAGRVGHGPVQLPRLGAQHSAGVRVVAGQAVFPAGVVPGLLARTAILGADRDVFGQARGEQVGVRIVRAPLIGHAIHAALIVPHQQPRLQPPCDRGVGVIRGQLKGLYEYRAGRKSPFSVRCKTDLGTLGDRQVAALGRPVGPEGDDEIVGNEA